MENLNLEEIEIILMHLGKVSTYPMQPSQEKKFIALLTKLENMKSFQQSVHRTADGLCSECGKQLMSDGNCAYCN